MDARDEMHHLLDQVPLVSTGHPVMVFGRGRRRASRRQIIAAVVSSLLLLAALVSVTFPSVRGQLPASGNGRDVAGSIPEGWQTLTAGEIAVSVPAHWHVSRPHDHLDPPAEASVGGPCLQDLYTPTGDSAPEESVAVVYDRPTNGECRPVGFAGPPKRPGLVLFESVRGSSSGVEVRPGVDWFGANSLGERTRIGTLDVWRVADNQPAAQGPNPLAPSTIVSYVADGLYGGLWVSHPDDPVVQRILSTVRPADPAE